MLIAGKYEDIAEMMSDKIKIIKIELKLISLGNSSKKYISGGKISKLNIFDSSILNFSIFIENKTPMIIPVIVAKKPIVNPVRKKIFVIEVLLTPKVLSIAISFVLFLTKIVNPDIILNAATIIISVKIINITFLSTFNAPKKD